MRKYIAVIILAFLLVFIWGNSVISKEMSSSVSKSVTEFIGEIFGINGENDAFVSNGEGIIRKLAHFTEFCALGAVLFVILKLNKKATIQNSLILGISGLFFPLSDETIQIFSNRGAQILDVWIDIAGFSFGCIILGVITLLKHRKARKKEEAAIQNMN